VYFVLFVVRQSRKSSNETIRRSPDGTLVPAKPSEELDGAIRMGMKVPVLRRGLNSRVRSRTLCYVRVLLGDAS
jgi:hypothetical protein